MKRISSALSNKISNVGFVCACLVVAIHVPHPTHGVGRLMDLLLCKTISQTAVPLFFAISGFLLAEKVNQGESWWRRAVVRRVRTLVVPFYVWPLISFLVCTATMVLIHWKAGVPLFEGAVGSDWPTLFIRLSGIDFTACIGPLWFVRALFCFVVVSPMLVSLMTGRVVGAVGLAALLLAYLLSVAFASRLPNALNGFFFYGFSLRGLFSFALGMFLNFHSDIIARSDAASRSYRTKRCLRKGLAVGITIVVSVVLFFCGRSSGVLNVLAPLFLAYAIWSLVPSTPWPRVLVTASFPIFLMHCIFLAVFLSFPGWVPDAASLGGYLFFWIAPIIGSILVAWALRRACPSFANIAFGGR